MQTLGLTPPSATRPYHSFGGGYFKVLISPDETNGEIAVVEKHLPQGAEPPMHVHANEDETFYILEGEISFKIGGQSFYGKQGNAIHAPRQIEHLYKIETPEARFLVTITPGNFVNFFLDFSKELEGMPYVKPVEGPPPADVKRYMVERLKTAYNVHFIGE